MEKIIRPVVSGGLMEGVAKKLSMDWGILFSLFFGGCFDSSIGLNIKDRGSNKAIDTFVDSRSDRKCTDFFALKLFGVTG